MKQVLVLSEGGLGNQLFQASFAHWFAEHHPTKKVRFIDSNSSKDRPFELTHLFDNCEHVGIPPRFTILGLTISELLNALRRRFRRIWPFFENLFVFREPNFIGNPRLPLPKSTEDFDLGLDRLPKNNWILCGYFQTAGSKHLESSCFTASLEKLIKVCSHQKCIGGDLGLLHIRRGDYTKESFGLLSLEYFRNQIEKFSNLNLDWVVFTEDSSVFNDLFELLPSSVNIIDGVKFGPWDFLDIATRAKVTIGSNSTMSWWGCALTSKNGGISVMPEYWKIDLQLRDLGLFLPRMKLGRVIWS